MLAGLPVSGQHIVKEVPPITRVMPSAKIFDVVLPGSLPPVMLHDFINDEIDYILKERILNGRIHYLVKWKDFDVKYTRFENRL